MEPINARIPPTAIPRIRKGSSNNQIMGYRSKAKRASGQHRTNKMHHSKNLIIGIQKSNFIDCSTSEQLLKE
jgi:hypothetical protein